MKNIFSLFKDNNFNVRLYTLLLQNEVCFCEMTDIFDVPAEKIRDHLNNLVDYDLIQKEKRENWEYYRAKSNPVEEVRNIVLKEDSQLWHQLHDNQQKIKQNDPCGSGSETRREFNSRSNIH